MNFRDEFPNDSIVSIWKLKTITEIVIELQS